MASGGLVAWCKRLTTSNAFHGAVVAVILANAVLVGIETSRPLVPAAPRPPVRPS